jgi:hypothetical protein
LPEHYARSPRRLVASADGHVSVVAPCAMLSFDSGRHRNRCGLHDRDLTNRSSYPGKARKRPRSANVELERRPDLPPAGESPRGRASDLRPPARRSSAPRFPTMRDVIPDQGTADRNRTTPKMTRCTARPAAASSCRWGAGIEAAYARPREWLARGGDLARQHGLILCVETPFAGYKGEGHSSSPSRLAGRARSDRSPQRARHARLQPCLHKLDFDGRRDDLVEEVKALAPWSKHLHMHDSFGRQDDIWMYTEGERMA